jgi:pimeloyl-ACP methyl ester carboxylesterase
VSALDARPAERFAKPSGVFYLSEAVRAATELAFSTALLPLIATLPKGDGHTVLVLPGFGAGNASTLFLRGVLGQVGYQAKGWRSGRNLGPSPVMVDELQQSVASLYRSSGEKISIIGWSLGGIYARLLAERMPNSVRLVITLGTPFRATSLDDTHAGGVFKVLGLAKRNQANSLDYPIGYRGPVPVPSTSIFTKSDGIVPWRACIDERDSGHENIEVFGSHCGLGHHPGALTVIANRLSQPSDAWKHYEPSGAARQLTRTWSTLPH